MPAATVANDGSEAGGSNRVETRRIARGELRGAFDRKAGIARSDKDCDHTEPWPMKTRQAS